MASQVFQFSSLLFKGNHTIAQVKGHEEYGTLKEGLKNVCHSVNQLVEKGYIEIDGKKVNLHFHLGGDYKVSK